MATTIGAGFSQSTDPQQATLQACIQVKAALNAPQTDLVIAFVCPNYISSEIFNVITHSLKPKRFIGSSAGTIIFSDAAYYQGIAIIGINSNEINFGISAIANIEDQDMHYVGFDLARKASLDLGIPQREMFMLFAQGIEQANVQFIQGIKETLGQAFPLTGAISSDHGQNKRAHQFFQDQILSHGTVGLLLGGKGFSVALDCRHGFKPLGKPRTMTRVEGNIIHTIDHQPAVDIYKHFLGDKVDLKGPGLSSQAGFYPLGIVLENRQYLLRNVFDILSDGSIVCQGGGFSSGSEVHLMISNDDFCRQSALEAAMSIKNALSGKVPQLILILESWARHKIGGRSIKVELEVIKSVLGYKIPLVGMSCFGEIAPFGSLNDIKNTYLHNGSILITAVA